MVTFRKRFSVEFVAKVNEYVVTGKWAEDQRNVDRNDKDDKDDDSDNSSDSGSGDSSSTGDDNAEKAVMNNQCKLVMDATVAPSDIKYPTDVDLIYHARNFFEEAIDILWDYVDHTSHKLPYNAKKARKSYLNFAKSKKRSRKLIKRVIGEQLEYLDAAIKRYDEFYNKIEYANDLIRPLLAKRIAVSRIVYDQQLYMYQNNVRKCNNRVVSIEQPYIRPINRGKTPNPTEFGQKLHLSVVDGFTFLEQTSWENFNESEDLKLCVEEYKRKFGFYPEAVLADKIYQSKANKAFCKEKGIRLSGPKLGRRPCNVTQEDVDDQAYADACERNIVESRNGILKRRYGLSRIMSRLDETAKGEAAFIILAMNVALKIEQHFCANFRNQILLLFNRKNYENPGKLIVAFL